MLGEFMAYIRPQNLQNISKSEKNSLLSEYIAHYKKAVQEHGVEALNAKIPRETFSSVLNTIGEFLQDQSNMLLKENNNIKIFLENNPLPPHMATLLPENYRVFALLLNALKQWVSAESSATDRYILGGTARQACREATNNCIVTGEKLGKDAELHHPVRDGRPPILLSKKGHDIVEAGNTQQIKQQATLTEEQVSLWDKLQRMRAKRNQSWKQLREGCLAHSQSSSPCRPGAKSFANVASKETGKTPEEIIRLLDAAGK